MTFLDKLFGRNKKKTGRVLSDFDKNYFTGKELGKGAFGIDLVMIAVVKEVVRKSDSKKFAANIIYKSRFKNEMDSIHTEIDVLKKLQHPNIVKLVDLYQTNDHFYLVMDLATGGE
jgi:calcium/calmodulin-dependent protein kinase I